MMTEYDNTSRSGLPSQAMTPDERLAEVTAILAYGVLQIRKRHESAENAGEKNSLNSGRAPLEVSDETVLSVTNG